MKFRPILVDQNLIDRFWQYVYIRENGCWQWLGAIDKKSGYGGFQIGYSSFQAHRVSYTIFFKDPGEKLICHTCDNKWCVSPFHLFMGSNSDNMQDWSRKHFTGNYYNSNKAKRWIIGTK